MACWYSKAVDYMDSNTAVAGAFVSTNSITQGEQVGVLWNYLLNRRVRIKFAHRTFEWTSEATRGRAAVHCVIVGFMLRDVRSRKLYEYSTVRDEPIVINARKINPYLVDAADVVVTNRRNPVCIVPTIGIDNKPIDGGNYLFTPEEKDAFVHYEPSSASLFRRWLGATEFINNIERWCLWLGNTTPAQIRGMPRVLDRVKAVQDFRRASDSVPTQRLAETPTRFHVENVPTEAYLLIPRHSAIHRSYIPLGFIDPEILSGDANLVISGATLFHFGVLSSTMHMAWVRTVCGRIKSDYRYSAGIVYNNYPWPSDPAHQKVANVEAAAQEVIDARAKFPESTLADLYDSRTMPTELVRAHQKLDKAVDKCYRSQPFTSEMNRVEFLFAAYEELTAPLVQTNKKRSKKKARRRA